MTWKEAVAKVASVRAEEMLLAARGLVSRISEADREEAVVRALIREAHLIERRETRVEELRAVRRTPGRGRVDLGRVSNELKKRLGPVLKDWRESLRLEWTAELLASSFTLRDGTAVTWGDATVAQHKERATIFLDNAAANIDGAARHNAAIQAIEHVGATSLNDALERAA